MIKYPYTNMHELNLDWMLEEFSKVEGVLKDFAAKWADIQTGYGEIRADYDAIKADWANVQTAFAELEAAWETYKNNTLPNMLNTRFVDIYNVLEAQYEAWTESLGVVEDFGNGTDVAVSQRVSTEAMFHRLDEFDDEEDATTDLNLVKFAGYYSVASPAKVGTISNLPAQKTGTFCSYGAMGNIAGVYRPVKNRAQTYSTYDGEMWMRTSIVTPGLPPTETWGDWKQLVANVASVNGKTGTVTLDADDVGAQGLGTLTVNGVTYTVRKSTTDEGVSGTLTFVIEE